MDYCKIIKFLALCIFFNFLVASEIGNFVKANTLSISRTMHLTNTPKFKFTRNEYQRDLHEDSERPSLNLLRQLHNPDNFENFIENHVRNVKVISPTKGRKYLVYKDTGKDVKDTLGNRVEVRPASVPRTTITTYPFHTISINKTFEKPFRHFGRARSKQSVSEGYSSAKCKLVETTVDVRIKEIIAPHIEQTPTCIRVERCDGCCSPMETCQPRNVTFVQVPVEIYEFKSPHQGFEFINKTYVEVERHIGCSCGCKIKAEHCNQRQTYNSDKCSCVCNNSAEREHCIRRPDRIWNSATCACDCKEVRHCSSGFYFDLGDCRCKK